MARKSFDANKKVGMDKNYFSGDFTTPESLVIDLLKKVPIIEGDIVIDAGSGKRKVWFDNIPSTKKIESELIDGSDFLKFNKEVDWCVGNPPFWEFIPFVFKASEISKKGFAFLTNHSRLNQITPVRLRKLEEKGFYLSSITIFAVKKWFGRYYFLVFSKEKSKNIDYLKVNYEEAVSIPPNPKGIGYP
jgi:hypothetical protein